MGNKIGVPLYLQGVHLFKFYGVKMALFSFSATSLRLFGYKWP